MRINLRHKYQKWWVDVAMHRADMNYGLDKCCQQLKIVKILCWEKLPKKSQKYWIIAISKLLSRFSRFTLSREMKHHCLWSCAQIVSIHLSTTDEIFRPEKSYQKKHKKVEKKREKKEKNYKWFEWKKKMRKTEWKLTLILRKINH